MHKNSVQLTAEANASLDRERANNRLAYVDVAKGIGIILVVFAHVNMTPFLQTSIYTFHMPLFFILSGYLFRQERYPGFGAFVKNRLLRLIVPYAVFSILSILAVMATDLLRAGAAGLVWNEYILHLYNFVLSRGSLSLVNPSLWYLTCLFLLEILYYLIVKLASAHRAVIVTLACGLMSVAGWFLMSEYAGLDGAGLPWSLDGVLFSIGFFALGNLLAKQLKKAANWLGSSRYKWLLCMGILVACMAVVIPVGFWNGKVSIGSKILNNGFLLYLTGAVGSAGVLALSVALSRSKVLVFLGRNTLPIMCIHHLLISAIAVVYARLGQPHYDNTALAQTLLPFAIVFGISVLFAVVYNWVMRRIASVFSKK